MTQESAGMYTVFAQDEDDALDGPPELLFAHGGHTTAVSDCCWCPAGALPGGSAGGGMWAASVAEDNILQVWRPADDVLFDEHARAATKRQRLE